MCVWVCVCMCIYTHVITIASLDRTQAPRSLFFNAHSHTYNIHKLYTYHWRYISLTMTIVWMTLYLCIHKYNVIQTIVIHVIVICQWVRNISPCRAHIAHSLTDNYFVGSLPQCFTSTFWHLNYMVAILFQIASQCRLIIWKSHNCSQAEPKSYLHVVTVLYGCSATTDTKHLNSTLMYLVA